MRYTLIHFLILTLYFVRTYRIKYCTYFICTVYTQTVARHSSNLLFSNNKLSIIQLFRWFYWKINLRKRDIRNSKVLNKSLLIN